MNWIGRDFEEYLGVRYAAAPVDELRWEKPQLPEAWDDVIDTVVFGAECYQFEGNDTDFSEYSEDCLFLNVYVPGWQKKIPNFINSFRMKTNFVYL